MDARKNELLACAWYSYLALQTLERKKGRGKISPLIVVHPEDAIQQTINAMEQHGIDQLPVVTEDGRNVGHINDVIAMQVVYERKDPAKTTVGSVMGRPTLNLTSIRNRSDL
ncbi:MAG: CBS domain-containing protein [Candidatus Obscuribacterales bacterium]